MKILRHLLAACVLLAGCDGSAAKFHLGDRVHIKYAYEIPGQQGKIIAMFRPFRAYHYCVMFTDEDGLSNWRFYYDDDLVKLP